jgi:acyl-[acyl-carrier-protein]-phospholipid O-acyltransferase / long-chain-fatty-acid--[acyl-carrier-protein] ligase
MKIFGERSSFFYLNATQFFVTIIDSIFRLIVAYSLIDLMGSESTNWVLAILAALFVAPFLLFSMPAGELADRFCKRTIIIWTLWAELIFMMLALIAFYMKDVYSSYSALFLIALQSAVFNPSKYSIIPEIVKEEEISRVNGILTLTTYLSIIAGTFLASFVSDVTGRNYVVAVYLCIFFSIIAIFTGYAIEKTPVQDPTRRINKLFFVQVVKSLMTASHYKYLLLACVCSACFLFTASFTQLNLIPFGVQSLGITDVQTGYVYLAAALGLGVGSFIVGTLSGRFVELGLSIWGGIGTAISYFCLYAFSHSLVICCFFFFTLGVSGGMFVVPLDAFIQVASPNKSRGSVVAASTFLSYVAVLLAAIYLYVLGDVLQLKAAQGFLIVSIGISVVVSFMAFRITNALYRAFALTVARFFITVDASELAKGESIVIVTKHKRICKLALMTLFHDMHIFSYEAKHLKNIKKRITQGSSFCLISNSKDKVDEIKKEFESVKVVDFKRVAVSNGSFFHFCKIASIHVDFKRPKA